MEKIKGDDGVREREREAESFITRTLGREGSRERDDAFATHPNPHTHVYIIHEAGGRWSLYLRGVIFGVTLFPLFIFPVGLSLHSRTAALSQVSVDNPRPHFSRFCAQGG